MREQFAGRYRLRLTDVRTPPALGEDEEFVEVDLRDLGAVQGVVEGVDAVVHLGGIASEDTWEAIRDVNIDGTYNVFESARRSGVKRVVYASSVHAVGFYPRSRTIDSDVTVLPDSRYGVSKAFGEALGALYANKYGLQVMAVRIGNAYPEPIDERRLSIWTSHRDLAQLIGIGLDHPGLRFEIAYGVSRQYPHVVGQHRRGAAWLPAGGQCGSLGGNGHGHRARGPRRPGRGRSRRGLRRAGERHRAPRGRQRLVRVRQKICNQLI